MSEPAATARVVVTLELSGLGTWGTSCAIEQIYKQATDAAKGKIHRAFSNDLSIKIVDTKAIAVYIPEK